MSLENEDLWPPDIASEKFDVALRVPKISYSRDFLLSLQSLATCKKLPNGFNESLLSEIGDGLQIIPDRPRISGSLPVHGFRRMPYGSSPPTQGDSGDFSRGIHGKWEIRRNDRDSDSQSDWDSDSGRRFGHQSRGSRQTREQDGLLGSGSFPRPFGYATGASAPKMKANEQCQLSKSNEPYHPPRPYKAVPHTRKDTDSYNDETFGSMECASEDRAEAERKRRASFETMRKEQQKALHEKQNFNLDRHKEDSALDHSEVLDGSKDEKELIEVSSGIPIISNDVEKLSLTSQSLASRPLVPPGFKNNILEQNMGSKSLIQLPLSERPLTNISLLDAEGNLIRDGMKDDFKQQFPHEISLVDGQPAAQVQHSELVNKQENVNSLTTLDVPILKLGIQNPLPLTSCHSNSHETLDNLGLVKHGSKSLEGIFDGEINGTNSTSVLEDFLGTRLSVNNCDFTSIEQHNKKPNDLNSVQASKFAQWFFEEETKSVDKLSGTSTDLLSVIVSSDKDRYQVSDLQTSKNLLPDFSDKILEQLDQLEFDMRSTSNGISSQLCINNNTETIPTVLTCEDLEQSILSEYSANDTAVPFLTSWNSSVASTEQNANVDGDASQHLLSLLQKGTAQSMKSDIETVDKFPGAQEFDMDPKAIKSNWEQNSNSIPNSVNALTLETLFGTAFMKELQSVEAPVSVQRGSTGSAQHDTSELPALPFPISDDQISSTSTSKIGLQQPNHEYGVFGSNQGQQTMQNKAENWRAFDDSQNDIMSLFYNSETAINHAEIQEAAESQLPGENLISTSDSQTHRVSRFTSIGNSSNSMDSSLDGEIGIMDKLAAFSDVKDQQLGVGSENPPFTRDPYEQFVSRMPYGNLQMQESLSQFQTSQMSPVRSLYHQFQSHPGRVNSEMTMLGSEPVFNHDSSAVHQFTSNVNFPTFPHPNVRVAGFEVPVHPSIRHQQMHMSGNRPPYMLPDFSRGGPAYNHGNQLTSIMQEMNQIQNLPFGPRVHSVRGLSMPFSGNPPEAFQRLIEMELRSNSKQAQPLAPGRHQGFHGHEAGTSFQYR